MKEQVKEKNLEIETKNKKVIVKKSFTLVFDCNFVIHYLLCRLAIY